MSNLLHYSKERDRDRKYLPGELLLMYRQRSRLTQAQLAEQLGLQSRQMIYKWESSETLPKADRLKKLIEFYLLQGVFVAGREREEAQQLWSNVKNMFDTNKLKPAIYPVFDEYWFETLTDTAKHSKNIALKQEQEQVKTQPALQLPLPTFPKQVSITNTPTLTPPHNLLRPLNRLIGREHELSQLCTLLSSHQDDNPNTCRLLTITGPGGTGKTRLASELALSFVQTNQEFADGVYWVGLESVRDFRRLALTIAQTLDCPQTGSADILERLKTYLWEKQILLVLDNFEQLVEAGPQVVELLQATTALKMLITSREALRVAGEQQYYLAPLTIPLTDKLAEVSLEQLKEYSSIELLVERMRQLNPDFELTTYNVGLVAELCIKLDGLPLALELVAGRTRFFSLPQLLKELIKPLDVLTGGARDWPARHQILRNTLNWSYQLLEPQEQQVLNCLGVFRGSLGLKALEKVGSSFPDRPVVELVVALVEKSLVQLRHTTLASERAGKPEEEEEVRLTLLETVREYAWEQLEASGELAITCQRHAEYFLELVLVDLPALAGKEWSSGWLARLDLEYPNIQLSLGWFLPEPSPNHLLATEVVRKGLQLAGAVARYWMIRGFLVEGVSWLSRALKWGRLTGLAQSGEFAKVLKETGLLELSLGNYLNAQLYLEESLGLYQKLENTTGLSHTLYYLSVLAAYQGQLKPAQQFGEQSLNLCRQIGDKAGSANALELLGSYARQHGLYEQAATYLEEGYQLMGELDDKLGSSRLLHNLGVLAFDQQNYNQAEDFFKEALVLKRELGYTRHIPSTLFYQGRLAAEHEDFEQALALQEEALAISRKIGDKPYMFWGLIQLTRTLRRRANYPAARRACLEALQLCKEMSNKIDLTFGLLEVGLLAVKLEYYEQALVILATVDYQLNLSGVVLSVSDHAEYEQNLDKLKTVITPPIFEAVWQRRTEKDLAKVSQLGYSILHD